MADNNAQEGVTEPQAEEPQVQQQEQQENTLPEKPNDSNPNLGYMGLKMMGMNDADIINMSIDTQTPVGLEGKDQAYDKYKDLAKQNGIVWDKDTFSKLYDSASGAHNSFKQNVYDGLGSPVLWQKGWSTRFDKNLGLGAPQHRVGVAPPDPRFENTDLGYLRQMHSDGEILDQRGTYIDQNGNTQDLRKWLSKRDDFNEKEYWLPTKALIKGKDAEGNMSWVEKNMTDVLKDSEIRSAFGPQPMHRGWLDSFLENGLNMAVKSLPAVAGSFIEVLGEWGKMVSGFGTEQGMSANYSYTWRDRSNEQDWKTDVIGNYLQNFSAWRYVKPSVRVENGEWNGSADNLAWGFGGAIGSIAQMIMARGMVAPWVRSGFLSQKGAGMIVKGSLSLVSANHVWRAGREAGISDRNLAIMYPIIGGATYAAESLVPWEILTKGASQYLVKGEMAKDIAKETGKTMARKGVNNLSAMGEKEAVSLAQRIAQRSNNFWSNFVQKSKAAGEVVGPYASTAVKGGIEEGIEEVAENMMHNGAQLVHDALVEGSLVSNDPRNFSYRVVDHGVGGDSFKMFYKKNIHTGKEVRISGETYAKEVQLATEGEGQFGKYDPSHSFGSNLVDRVPEGIAESFVFGSFAGGFMSAIDGAGQTKHRSSVIHDYVADNKENLLFDEIKRLKDEGLIDDEVYSRYNEEINLSIRTRNNLSDTMKRVGMKRPSPNAKSGIAGVMLKEYSEGSIKKSLIREALDNRQQREEAKANLEAIEDKDSPEIEKINNLINDLDVQYEDITSGKRFNGKVVDSLIMAEATIPYFKALMSDGGVIDSNSLLAFNERYRKAKDQLVADREASTVEKEAFSQSFPELLESIKTTKVSDEIGGITAILDQVSEAQDKMTRMGATEAQSRQLSEVLKNKSQEILEAIPSYFEIEATIADGATKEQKKEANKYRKELKRAKDQISAMGDEAPEEHDLLSNAARKMTSSSLPGMASSTISRMDKMLKKQEKLGRGDDLENAIEDVDMRKSHYLSYQDMSGNVIDIDATLSDLLGVSVESLKTHLEEKGINDLLELKHKIETLDRKREDEEAQKILKDINEATFDAVADITEMSKKAEEEAGRSLNAEDAIILQNLGFALINNSHILDVNHRVMTPVSKTDPDNVGQYAISPDQYVDEVEYDNINVEIENRKILLSALGLKHQIDVGLKTNYQNNIRYKDIAMQTTILEGYLSSENSHLSAEERANIMSDTFSRTAELVKKIEDHYSDKRDFDLDSMNEIEKINAEIGSLLHKDLNGKNSEKVVKDIVNYILSIKKMDGIYWSYSNAKEFSKGFEEAFGFSSLTKPGDNTDTHEYFTKLYVSNFLQNTQRLDPILFFKKMRDVQDSEKEGEGFSYSYEQERAIYQISAFYIDPNIRILDYASKAFLGNMKKSDSRYKDTAEVLSGGLFFRGYAGTGKSKVVPQAVSSIVASIKGEDKIGILISSPSVNLGKSLVKAFSLTRSNSGDAPYLNDDLLNISNDKIKENDYFFIDEASTILRSDLKNIHERIMSINPNARIVYSGDNSQMTDKNSKQKTFIAAENFFERTMPLTEVFRSGSADIANIQEAYRKSFMNRYKGYKKAVLPSTIYDSDRNNGAQILRGGETDVYDYFVKDMNSSDEYKTANTILVVYDDVQRDEAINHIKPLVDSYSGNIEDRIYTLTKPPKGSKIDHHAQGHEAGRVLVAVDIARTGEDMYGRAMLTATSRAASFGDHSGYLLMMSPYGESNEGIPVLAAPKVVTKEDLDLAKTRYSTIIGETVDSVGDPESWDSVSQEKYNATKENIDKSRERIKKLEKKINIDGNDYRYTIDGVGVFSNTERIAKMSGKISDDYNAYAHRGSIGHKIIEIYLKNKGDSSIKNISVEDINYLKNEIGLYNKSLIHGLRPISENIGDTDLMENPFFAEIISKFAEPFMRRSLKNGSQFLFNESVVGITSNGIVSTTDLIEVVGYDGDTPIVDVWDFKFITNNVMRQYDNVTHRDGKPEIIKIDEDTQMYANKKNTSLLQLAVIGEILRQGDSVTGVKPMKINTVNVAKIPLTTKRDSSENDSPAKVEFDANNEKYIDSNIFADEDFQATYGEAAKKIVGSNKKSSSKNVPSPIKNTTDRYAKYDVGSSVISESNEVHEITGVWIDPDDPDNIQYELNGDSYVSEEDIDTRFSPMASPVSTSSETLEDLFKKSALMFKEGGQIATSSSAVVSFYPGEKKDKFGSISMRTRMRYMSNVSKDIASGSSPVKVDIKFAEKMEMINDKGKKEVFNNVMYAEVPLSPIDSKKVFPAEQRLIDALKSLPEHQGAIPLTDAQARKMIRDHNLNIVSVYFQPDKGFGKNGRSTGSWNDPNKLDYSGNEHKSVVKQISEGFMRPGGIMDPHTEDLRAYHTALVNMRKHGSDNNGIVGTGTITSVEPVKIYMGESMITLDQLKKNNPGLKIGRPFFKTQAFETSDGYNLASWMVEVYYIHPDVDGKQIVLDTITMANSKEAKKEFDSMRNKIKFLHKGSPTLKDVYRTGAYKLFNNNTGIFIDKKTGEARKGLITGNLKGAQRDITDFMSWDKPKLTIEGNMENPKEVLARLADALVVLESALFDYKNPAASKFRIVAQTEIGEYGRASVRENEIGKLKTKIHSVHRPGLYISNDALSSNDNITGHNETDEDDDVDTMDYASGRPAGRPVEEPTIENNPQDHVVNKKKNNTDFLSVSKNVFGGSNIANKVLKDVSFRLFSVSPWNPDTSKKFKGFHNMIEAVYNSYVKMVDDKGTAIEVYDPETKKTITNIKHINGSNIHLLDNDFDRMRFAAHTFKKNKRVYYSMITRMWPDMDLTEYVKSNNALERLRLGKTKNSIAVNAKISKEIENDQIAFEEGVRERATASAHSADAEFRKATNSLSEFVHWAINATPLNSYTLSESGVPIASRTRNFIDSELLHKHLVMAGYKSYFMTDDQESRGLSSYIARVRDNLITEANSHARFIDSDTGRTSTNETYNTIMTFVDKFMKIPDGVISTKKQSVLYLREYGDLLGQDDNTKLKIDAANNLMSALISHLSSHTTKSNYVMDISGSSGNWSHTTKTTTVNFSDELKSQIMKTTNFSMFNVSEDGSVVLKNKFQDLFIQGDHKYAKSVKYEVTSNGVWNRHIGSGGKKLVNINDKGNILRFSMNEAVTTPDVLSFMNDMGMKGIVSKSTIDHYLNNDQKNESEEDRSDSEVLAEIIGMISMTAKHSVFSQNNDFSWKEGEKLLESYYDGKNRFQKPISKDVVTGIQDDVDVDEKFDGSNIMKPSDLDVLLGNLAKVEITTRGDEHLRFFFNLNNKRQYADVLTSMVFRRLHPKSMGVNPSDGIKTEFNRDLRNSNPEDVMGSYLVDVGPDGSIDYMNPLVDKNSGWDILDVYITNGIRSKYGNAIQGDNMIDKDFIDMSVNGFASEVLKDRKNQTFRLPYHPLSDSNIFTYNFKMNNGSESTDRLLIKSKGKRSYVLNMNIVSDNIEKIFDYYARAREKNVMKWVSAINQFSSMNGLPISIENANEIMQNPEGILPILNNQVIPFIEETRGEEGVKAFNDFIRNNMEETSEYMISNGRAVPGKISNMDIDDIYNIKNYIEFNALEDQEDRARWIRNKFNKRNFAAMRYMWESGFHVSQMDSRLDSEMRKEFYTEEQIEDDDGNKKKITKINPIIEGYLYAFHISDHYMSQVLQGGSDKYKNVGDFYKRSKGLMSPGWHPDVENPNGLNEFSKYVTIDDSDPSFQALLSEMGSNVYDQLGLFGSKSYLDKAGDALTFTNPITHELRINSYGGQDMAPYGEGMVKSLYFKNDLIKNTTTYIKHAELPMSDQILKTSKVSRYIFEKMMGPDLYNVWTQGTDPESSDFNPMTIKDFTNYIIDNDLKGQYLDFVAFKSGTKVAPKHITPWDSDSWIDGNVGVIENREMKIQNNPSHNIEDMDISRPSQLLAQISVGNSDIGTMISNLAKDISENSIEKIENEFMVEGMFDKERFLNHLRQRALQSSRGMENVAKLAELLSNPNINMNDPGVRSKVLPLFINPLNKSTINLRFNGVQMTQSPGFVISTVRNEQGVYKEDEARRLGISGDKGSLRPMEFYADPEMTILETDVNRITSGQSYVKPGEAVVGYGYFKQFGLDKYIEANPDLSLNEVLTINGINLRNLNDSKKVVSLIGTESQEDTELEAAIKTYFASTQAVGAAGQEAGLVQEVDRSKDVIGDKFTNATEAIEWVRNFRDTLRLIAARIPTSGTSSAFIYDIVGWVQDSGNVIFTAPQKNLLDGSDYDIDQLFVYSKAITGDGKIHTEGHKGDVNNIFEAVWSYYMNSSNSKFYMAPIDVQNYEQEAKDVENKMSDYVNSFNDFGSVSYYYNAMTQGSAMISRSANSMKDYGFIVQAQAMAMKQGKSISNGFILDPEGYMPGSEKMLISALASNTNIALDNPSNPILGVLGITTDASNIWNAITYDGLTEDEAAAGLTIEKKISNFFSDKEVKSILSTAKKSRSVKNFGRSTLLELIHEKIDGYKNVSADAIKSLKRKERDLLLKLEDPEANYGVVPGAEELSDGSVVFTSERDAIRMTNEKIDEARMELSDIQSKILDNSLLSSEENIVNLERLLRYARLGEALYRVNHLTKLDGKGIPVFDYNLEMYIRNIEYTVNQPIEDFLSGKTQRNKDWYLNHHEYTDPEKLDQIKLDEEAIRDFIDHAELGRNLPNIMQHINVLSKVKNWYSQGFIVNGKLFNDVKNNFLKDQKLNWFLSEKDYYEFRRLHEQEYMVSLFFATRYKDKRFPSMSGVVKGEILNVANYGDRFRFGIEFPNWIMNHINDLKSKEKQTHEDERITNNEFIKSLVIEDGIFLSVKNGTKLKDEDIIFLQSHFKRLPEDLKEKFRVYQLAKDGFRFTKSSLYNIIDDKIFEDYSGFLDVVEKASNSYEDNNDDVYTFVLESSKGDVVSATLPELFNNVFLNDVGPMSRGMSLLRSSRALRENNTPEHLIPNQTKVSEYKGGYGVQKVKVKGSEDTFTIASNKLFNGFDPASSLLERGQTLKSISPEDYETLQRNGSVVISFNKRPQYGISRILLPDAKYYDVKEVDDKRNTIRIAMSKGGDAVSDYRGASTKEDMLTAIRKNSKNPAYKDLADHLLSDSSLRSSVFAGQNIVHATPETDPLLLDAEEKGGWYGYFKPAKGKKETKLVLNTARLKSASEWEKTYLHETIHNITTAALRIPKRTLNSPKFKDANPRVVSFVNEINTLFNQAKKNSTKYEKDLYNGFKDVDEFVADAFTNEDFQRHLARMKAVEGIEAEGSIFDKFLSGIKDLLGLSSKKNSFSILDQVITITGNFTSLDSNFRTGIIYEGISKDGVRPLSARGANAPEVKSIGDLRTLLYNSERTSILPDKENDDYIFNFVLNNIKETTGEYKYYDETWSLPMKTIDKGNGKYSVAVDREKAESIIKNEIIPVIKEIKSKFRPNWLGFLSSGGDLNSLNEYFGTKKGGDSRYNQKNVEDVLRHIDYNPNDKFFFYSDIEADENLKKYDIPYLESFKGDDPLIVVHESISGDESISIIDFGDSHLGGKHGSSNILQNFISNDMDAIGSGLRLKNTEGDFKKLQLALTSMAIKRANPNVKIRNIAVLGMRNNDNDFRYVDMYPMMMNSINAMSEVEGFMDQLPEEIKSLFTDSNLKKDIYDQPWMFKLKKIYEEYVRDNNTESGYEKYYRQGMIGKMDAYLNGEDSKQFLIDSLNHRVNVILRNQLSSSEFARSEEVNYITNVLYDLQKTPTTEKQIIEDMDPITSYGTTSHNIANPLIQDAQRSILNAENHISEHLMNWMKNLNSPLDRYQNRFYSESNSFVSIAEFGKDYGSEKFEKLFKKTFVKNLEGEEVEVESYSIHWDKNDPETKQAIKDRKISESDVEFGAMIMDKFENEMILNLMHDNRFDPDYDKSAAETELSGKWNKGMLPIMPQSSNELFWKGDVKSSAKKFLDKMSNVYDIYDENYIDDGKKKDIKRFTTITNRFMDQIGSGNPRFGSNSRMSMMGLKEDENGEVLLVDASRNSNMTKNLELLSMYMVGNSVRKRHYESKVLPYVLSINTILVNSEMNKGKGMDNSIKYLKTFVDRVVHGEIQDDAFSKHNMLERFNLNLPLDKTVNIAMAATTFSGVAYSVPVAMASMMQNNVQMIHNAMANDLGGTRFFGKKELAAAYKELFTNPKKIEALMHLYQIVERGEYDLKHNPRMRKTVKNKFTSHHAHKLNWYTDYYTRGVVMAAQMMKDGSYDAYTFDTQGELKYDESKDKQWKSEDGKILKQNIREKLIEQGSMNSDDKKLPRGYDFNMARNLKWISDKYIVGSYDSTTYTMMDSFTGFRMFTQFRRWLPDKYHNYFGKRKASAAGGKYIAIDEGGNKVAKWEQDMQEGIALTVLSAVKIVAEHKMNSFQEIKNMSDYQKYNLSKFAMDAATAAVLAALYNGLKADWDEDDKKGPLFRDSRLLRVLKNGYTDLVVTNPAVAMAQIASSPIPMLVNSSRITNALMGDWSQLSNAMPLSSTIKMGAEQYDILTDEE